MTPEERVALAEQLKANPLFALILNEIEASAIERLVFAQGDVARLECQLRVQAVREFRLACAMALHRETEPKMAPA
jgi:hypothetical protein